MFQQVFRIILFFIPVLFFSCANEATENKNLPVAENQNQVSDSAKKRLLQIIRGGWVNEEYILALEKYRSPMEAALYGLPEQQMAFDISQLRGDTLVNYLGRLNYHEGERFEVVFYKKADGKPGMLINEARNYISEPLQLNYEISNGDTTLLLTIVGEKNQTLRFRREFHNFTEQDEVILPAMELCINRKFFAGEWSNGKDKLSLGEYGQVLNFNGYKRYSVSFIHDHPASQPDEITFYNDSIGVTYLYTMKDKKLHLYESQQSDDGMEISRGKLVYTLERE